MSTQHIDAAATQQTSDIFGRPSFEGIAARAYQHYLERGGQDGYDLDDWLQAEREIRDGAAMTEGYEQEEDVLHQER
jgi:hypothetical protein